MSDVKLSVIIVAYRNKDILNNCIKSINDNNDALEETELIIVDNSPDNEVSDFIRETYPNVILKKSDNRGFGAGNNEGVRICKGEYLLFLNPDTILLEPVFRFAIDKFEKDNELGVFCVRLLNRNRKKTFSYFFIDRFDLLSAAIQRICNKLNIFLSNSMHPHGADMFIRKKMFIDAGMFDENIFMYEEEADLTKRIKYTCPAAKIRYFPKKTIIHLEGSSSPGFEGMCNTIHRLMKTEMYYCSKYKIPINRRIKQRLQYIRLKAFFYKFVNKDRYSEEKAYMNIYKGYLK